MYHKKKYYHKNLKVVKYLYTHFLTLDIVSDATF